jgi:hypothetical protein
MDYVRAHWWALVLVIMHVRVIYVLFICIKICLIINNNHMVILIFLLKYITRN